MAVALDLEGQRFGLLVAEKFVGRDDTKNRLWKCRCDCGGSSVVRTGDLRSGHTRSCGCWGAKLIGIRSRTHGMAETPLFLRWIKMIGRTTNPNNNRWNNYGGRGITVCERWQDFVNFAEDMGPTFSPELSLDRINNELGYEKDNCRWATPKEQALNRRSNRRIEVDGITMTMQEWGERLDIDPVKIGKRLRYGWSVERALELQ